jgi:hypothetical protein
MNSNTFCLSIQQFGAFVENKNAKEAHQIFLAASSKLPMHIVPQHGTFFLVG